MLLLLATGCNKYGYDAGVESVEYREFGVTVRGWYSDPFVAKRNGVCPEVVTSVDGKAPTRYNTCDSMTSRPDVTKLTGKPSFELQFFASQLTKGRHKLCADVVPYGAAAPETPQVCKDVDVEWDQFSQGVIDTAVVSDGVLTADGWFSHVRFTTSSNMYRATWYLDGNWVRSATDGITVTSVDRPDVRAAVGPNGQGLRISAPVQPGSHTICLGLDNGFGWYGEPDVCRTVVAP